jgi:hypothetical protein
MSTEAAKVVPESFLKKTKRAEGWAAEAKTKAVEEKKKSTENRKVIFARAKQYAEEYDAQVRSLPTLDSQCLFAVCSFVRCVGSVGTSWA